MDADQARDLLKPPTISVRDAGQVLNLSRNATYDAVRRGDIPSIRMGKRMLVLTAPLRRMLKIEGN